MRTELQDWARQNLGLRIGPETAAYLWRQAAGAMPVSIMGGDARTGLPLRREVPVILLRAIGQSGTGWQEMVEPPGRIG